MKRISLSEVNDAYAKLFFNGYVHAALRTSQDDDGNELYINYDESDIDPESLARMQADCDAFLAKVPSLDKALDADQAGIDFWLTRNYDGVGFWSRGLGDIGDRLTKFAHIFPPQSLYVGDDGKVYLD